MRSGFIGLAGVVAGVACACVGAPEARSQPASDPRDPRSPLSQIGDVRAHGADPPASAAPTRLPASRQAALSLEEAAAGPWRIDPARDRWRHPVETLRFFRIRPDMTIVEAWPGGGWYTAILAPYLKSGGGRLYAAHFDAASARPSAVRVTEAFRKAFVEDPSRYGDITLSVLSRTRQDIAPDASVDAVLTFRNVHNWMAQGYADDVFRSFYRVLKPGGLLGIEEHRLPPGREQDPKAGSGYVAEDYVIRLAADAGFELIARSQINANPRDMADHPFGVWTLPPTLRSSPLGRPPDPTFDHAPYLAIGESDRMTLLFRKPAG
jgi:predicted methyltransferase